MLTRLLFLAIGLFLGLTVCEVSVRIFVPDHRGLHVHPGYGIKDDFVGFQRLGLYDETLGWKLRPNGQVWNEVKEFRHEVRTNARGFRDDDHPFERIDDRKRILLLGDSFGMGDGVNRGELFADLLEETLPETDVINLSVNGYGTDQELLSYQSEGIRYNADVVLLAFMLANDPINNGINEQYGKRKPFFRLDGSDLVLDGVPVPYVQRQQERVPILYESQFPRHDWLDTHSALYAFVFHRLASINTLRTRWERSGLLHEQIAVFHSGHIWMCAKTPPPELSVAWDITEQLLLRWKRSVLDNGSIPAVVLIPSHLQADPSILETALAARGLDPSLFDPEAPNQRMISFCTRQHIPICDLLPTLQKAATSSLPIYYRSNPHWTSEGHRIAAARIAEFLKTERLWTK